jgi:hypothetical protein
MTWVILAAASDIPAAPTGSMIIAVTGVLMFLGGLFLMPLMIRHYMDREPKRRLMPDPINTREVQDHVTLTKFEQHEEKIDRKFGDVYRAINSEGKRLDNRINDVLTAVSKVEGAFHQSQRRQHPNG